MSISNELTPQVILVGIVVYNTDLEVLERTVESLSKSIIDLKIKLLCNSRNKAYQDQVSNLGSRFGAETIIDQENKGFGAGHNKIFASQGSDWYVCCNPDIIIEPSSIDKMVTHGKEHTKNLILCPKILNPDGTVQKVSRRHLTFSDWLHRQIYRILPLFKKPFEADFNYDKSQTVEFVSGCFFVISSQNFRLLNGFDENFFLYYEDADISIRANAFGPNFYIADAEVTHLWQKAWTSSAQSTKIQLRSLWLYFSKHGFTRFKQNHDSPRLSNPT